MSDMTHLKNFSLLTGTIIIFSLTLFVGGEWYLGLKYDADHRRIASEISSMGNGLCYAPSSNPKLIYTFTPNNHQFPCWINSQGYRDYEYPLRKNSNTFRILIIGDSVATGYGVTLDETFGKILEQRLNDHQRHLPANVEVITLARNGYSTSQEIIILENEAFRYSPDLIIWSYVLNDPADPIFHNANGEIGKYFYKPRFHMIDWIKREIFLAHEKRGKTDCPKEYHEMLHCVYWNQVEAHLLHIGQISKEKNIPIVFLIHPVFKKGTSFQAYPLTSLHSKLANLASRMGLMVADGLESYLTFRPDELRQPVQDGYDPWHPNAKGHRVLAEYLYHKILQGHYIEDRQCPGIHCGTHI